MHSGGGRRLDGPTSTSNPAEVAAALPATRAEIVPLHVQDDLTVLKVVWAPGMRIWPHNHLMWADIALYGGQEDNAFFRRTGGGIEAAGGRQLRTGDVAALGHETIHAVANPCRAFTGAIHVYGGDITSRPDRSEWDQDSGDRGALRLRQGEAVLHRCQRARRPARGAVISRHRRRLGRSRARPR